MQEKLHGIIIITWAVKKKQANIMEITKKDCKNKHEINIENYLMKEVILKGSTRDRYKNMSDED